MQANPRAAPASPQERQGSQVESLSEGESKGGEGGGPRFPSGWWEPAGRTLFPAP